MIGTRSASGIFSVTLDVSVTFLEFGALATIWIVYLSSRMNCIDIHNHKCHPKLQVIVGCIPDLVEYVKVYCLLFQQGLPVLIKISAQFLSQYFIDKIASIEKFTKTFGYRLVICSGMLVLIQALSNLIENYAV